MGQKLGLFDSNILIDQLAGRPEAASAVLSFYTRSISIVTWMEVMVGATPQNESIIREFLADYAVLPITQDIAERAVELRRVERLKLPDALILATAQIHQMTLVTRNTKDFPQDRAGIFFPYR